MNADDLRRISINHPSLAQMDAAEARGEYYDCFGRLRTATGRFPASLEMQQSNDEHPLKRTLFAACEMIVTDSCGAVREQDCVLMVDEVSLAKIDALPEIQICRKSGAHAFQYLQERRRLSIYGFTVSVVRSFTAVAGETCASVNPSPCICMVARVPGAIEYWSVEIPLPFNGRQPVSIYDFKSTIPFESIEIEPTDSVYTGDPAMPQWPARFVTSDGLTHVTAGVIVHRGFSNVAAKIMLAMCKEITKRPGVTKCLPMGMQLADGRFEYSLSWTVKEPNATARMDVGDSVYWDESNYAIKSLPRDLQKIHEDAVAEVAEGEKAIIEAFRPQFGVNLFDWRERTDQTGLDSAAFNRAFDTILDDTLKPDAADPAKESYIGLDGGIK